MADVVLDPLEVGQWRRPNVDDDAYALSRTGSSRMLVPSTRRRSSAAATVSINSAVRGQLGQLELAVGGLDAAAACGPERRRPSAEAVQIARATFGRGVERQVPKSSAVTARERLRTSEPGALPRAGKRLADRRPRVAGRGFADAPPRR